MIDLSSDVPCKVVRKGLWKMCSGLLADRQCSQEIAVMPAPFVNDLLIAFLF